MSPIGILQGKKKIFTKIEFIVNRILILISIVYGKPSVFTKITKIIKQCLQYYIHEFNIVYGVYRKNIPIRPNLKKGPIYQSQKSLSLTQKELNHHLFYEIIRYEPFIS